MIKVRKSRICCISLVPTEILAWMMATWISMTLGRSLFNCKTVGRTSDKMMAPSSICFRWSKPDYHCLWSSSSCSCSWVFFLFFFVCVCVCVCVWSGFRSTLRPLLCFITVFFYNMCFTMKFHICEVGNPYANRTYICKLELYQN